MVQSFGGAIGAFGSLTRVHTAKAPGVGYTAYLTQVGNTIRVAVSGAMNAQTTWKATVIATRIPL